MYMYTYEPINSYIFPKDCILEKKQHIKFLSLILLHFKPIGNPTTFCFVDVP